MRLSVLRMNPLLLPVRWVLALVLIFNGAVVSSGMAHEAMGGDHSAKSQVTSHCHHHADLSATDRAIHHPQKCPCCAGGDACLCGCAATFALPTTFPDLRPIAPQTLADGLSVPGFAAIPPHRLLRPPIV